MEYKRDYKVKSKSRKRTTLKYKRYKSTYTLIGGIGALCLAVGLYFGTDIFSDPGVDVIALAPDSSQYRKEVILAENSISQQVAGQKEENQSTNTGGQTIIGSLDKIANYSIDYYVMFPLYEGTLTQINGDWNDDGVRDDASDGGFGPLQETHSGLANTVDRMYDSNPEVFSWLKPFVDNPLSYMESCRGNDHANHKWSACKTHWDGSARLRAEVVAHTTTPAETKAYYDGYMGAAENDYLVPALQKLSSITGKPAEEIGHGTVAMLFSIYVRWGTKNAPTSGLNASMSEDQIIDALSSYAVNRASSVDKPRFKCSAGIAKAVNAGTLDIYSYYSCDGSCGKSHGISQGRSFGDLFGKR